MRRQNIGKKSVILAYCRCIWCFLWGDFIAWLDLSIRVDTM